MNLGLRYLRGRLIAALALVAAATIWSYAADRIRSAAVEEREGVAEAIDLALATMAEQLVYLGAIRDAIGPYLAADDRSSLARTIPELETAIDNLKSGLESGVMAPKVRAIFEDPLLDPFLLLQTVVDNGRLVAGDPERWGPRAAFNVEMANISTLQVLPLIRQIKEIEAADLAHEAALLQFRRQASVCLVLVLLAAIWLCIFRPVETRIREDRDALLAERRSAEAASAAKSTFIATMSHEFRTPLVGILGAAELLRDAEDDDRVQLSETILGSGRALLGILNDILTFSRIEAGAVEVRTEPTDLPDLAENIGRLFKSQAHAKDVKLVVEVDRGLAPRHRVDAMRLRQVLANLVGNAVKFTEHGSVTLRLAATGTTGIAQTLTFDVVDTGIGIPAETLDRIFEAFRQADDGIERRYGGTGLGLAIARKLAEAMGGRLTVTSTPGAGSTFRLVLTAPVCIEATLAASDGPQDSTGIDASAHRCGSEAGDAPDPRRASPRADPSSPETRGSSALVVDDNATNRMVAKRMLSGSGWRVEEACDGHEAIAAAERLRPTLVMMDVSMPGMDGYAATRRIRLSEDRLDRNRAWIVGASAHTGEEHRKLGLAAGMDEIIAKPFNRAEIERVLGRATHAAAPPARRARSA